LIEALLDLCAKLPRGVALVCAHGPADLFSDDEHAEVQVVPSLADVIGHGVDLAQHEKKLATNQIVLIRSRE
jgi:hypothetical protein